MHELHTLLEVLGEVDKEAQSRREEQVRTTMAEVTSIIRRRESAAWEQGAGFAWNESARRRYPDQAALLEDDFIPYRVRRANPFNY